MEEPENAKHQAIRNSELNPTSQNSGRKYGISKQIETITMNKNNFAWHRSIKIPENVEVNSSKLVLRLSNTWDRSSMQQVL